MCFIVALNSEIAFFLEDWNSVAASLYALAIFLKYYSVIFAHNTNMHHCTDPKFVDVVREQVSELLPVLYQGLKRRKCFQCLCEQLDLGFAKYPKMCNIFTWWLLCWYVWRTNQFYVCLDKPSLICLWRANCDLICCLVYI